jgi:hypothetical protein
MVTKLKYAIANCTEMDADFRLTEIDVTGWNAATSSATSAITTSNSHSNLLRNNNNINE